MQIFIQIRPQHFALSCTQMHVNVFGCITFSVVEDRVSESMYLSGSCWSQARRPALATNPLFVVKMACWRVCLRMWSWHISPEGPQHRILVDRAAIQASHRLHCWLSKLPYRRRCRYGKYSL